MQRALQLAKLAAGRVSPNPQVGAVIVHQRRIIGEGYHRAYGGKHAEVEAVESVKKNDLPLLSESTIYVTLEPCFHTGKTPPCVDLILKHGIPKVVIACLDPNPLVAGQSVQKLKNAGVEVVFDTQNEQEGKNVAAHFLCGMQKKRPYIVLKWAQTSDGFIGKENEPVWLTNQYSKRLVHKWRSEIAAIAVGANTLHIDNPSLTTRLWTGKSPARVTWFRNWKPSSSVTTTDSDKNNQKYIDTIKNSNFLKESTEKIFLFSEQTFSNEKTSMLSGFEIDMNKEDFLLEIMEILYREKIDSILIEGGAKTLQKFIDLQLWDEARVFTTPCRLENGIEAPKINGISTKKINIMGDKLDIIKPKNNCE